MYTTKKVRHTYWECLHWRLTQTMKINFNRFGKIILLWKWLTFKCAEHNKLQRISLSLLSHQRRNRFEMIIDLCWEINLARQLESITCLAIYKYSWTPKFREMVFIRWCCVYDGLELILDKIKRSEGYTEQVHKVKNAFIREGRALINHKGTVIVEIGTDKWGFLIRRDYFV